MSEPLPITLYMPCYNAAHFLDRVLPAVLAQTYPIADFFVIDDGSTDDTAAVAARHGVRVIRQGTNRGLGVARNTGIRNAKTDYIASLDADVAPRPDWLEKLAAHMVTGKVDGVAGNLVETIKDTLADHWRDAHMQQGWGEELIAGPEFLYGANNLYRKQALIDAGYYDESCRTNGEDVSMNAKLQEQGVRLLYDPAAVCEHLRTDTTQSMCRTYWNWVFFKSDPSSDDYLDRIRKMGRRLLLRRYFREDLRKGRLRLAAFNVWMYWEWRRHAAQQLRAYRRKSAAHSRATAQ